MNRYVAYRRISKEDTKRKKGDIEQVMKLGLQAQWTAITNFVAAEGGELVHPDGEPEAFWEIMSGGVDERPELHRAIAFAKKQKAYICVSKLDRLSRDAAFIMMLIKNKVKFVVAELGHDIDPTMLQFYAVIAERERMMIGQRTKDALAELKKSGKVLGNRTNAAEASQKGAQEQRQAADQFAANIYPIIKDIRAAGLSTLREIAGALNARGVKTARGGEWAPTTVKNIIDRMEKAA